MKRLLLLAIFFLPSFLISVQAFSNEAVMYDTFNSDSSTTTDGKLWINDAQNNFTLINIDSDVDAYCYDHQGDDIYEECLYRTQEKFVSCQTYSQSFEDTSFKSFYTVCNNTPSQCFLNSNLEKIYEVNTSQIKLAVAEIRYWKNCNGSSAQGFGSPSVDWYVYDQRRAFCQDEDYFAIEGRYETDEWDLYSPDFFCASNQLCDTQIDDENVSTSKTSTFNPCRLKTGEACTVSNECLTGVSCVQGICGNNADAAIVNISTIQILPNTVIIINRTAYARAIVNYVGNFESTVTIVGTFNNTLLTPLTTTTRVMQNSTNATFDFVFTPQSAGVLSFQINSTADINLTNNQFNLTLSTVTPPVFELHYERAALNKNDILFSPVPALQHKGNISDEFPFLTISTTEANPGTTFSPIGNQIHPLSRIMYNMTVRQHLTPTNSAKKNLVIVPDGFFASIGYPQIRSAVKRSKISTLQDTVIIEQNATGIEQAIGYSFGLCHEQPQLFEVQDGNRTAAAGGCPNHDSNGDGAIDNDCGPSGCQLNEYDSRLVSELVKNTTYTSPFYNFMGSNKTHTWIDRDTFNHLFNTHKTPDFTANDVLIISALIYKNGTLIPQTYYTMPQGILTNESQFSSGNYSLLIKNLLGVTIHSYQFEPDFTFAADNGSTISLNETFVTFAVPDSSSQTIIFERNGTTVSSLSKSLTEPVVTLDFLGLGKILSSLFNLTWVGTDVDLNPLKYSVLISSDNGTTYSTLSLDQISSSIPLNTSEFPYGEEYTVQVLATDGILTDSDISVSLIMGSPLKITNFSRVHTDINKTIYAATFINRGSKNSANINYTLKPGDGTNYTKGNISLQSGSGYSIIYELPTSNNLTIVSTFNITNGTVSDQETIPFTGFTAQMTQLLDLINTKVVEIKIENLETNFINNITWSLNTGEEVIQQLQPINLEPLQAISLIVGFNYTNLSNKVANFTATNGFNTASASLLVTSNELTLNTGTIYLNGSTYHLEFNTTNNWPQNATYNWTVRIDSTVINSSIPVTLNPGANSTTLLAHTLTGTGSHLVNVTLITGLKNYTNNITVAN